MTAKHVVLIVVGTISIAAFAGFVLLLALLLVADDAAAHSLRASKLAISVRHKMIYFNGKTLSKQQCVNPEIGVCETAVTLNLETHRTGGGDCQTKWIDPQPFFSQPEVSDFADYEFDLEPDKTYYWYVYLDSNDDCGFWLEPADERFETREIKLAAEEVKRIEIDFTRDSPLENKAQAK